MSVPVYRIDLDLRDNDMQKFVQLRKGDDQSKIVIRLREGGEPFKLGADDAAAVNFVIGSTYYELDCAVTEDGCAECTVSDTLTENEGTVLLWLKWGDGEAFHTTARFFAVITNN